MIHSGCDPGDHAEVHLPARHLHPAAPRGGPQGGAQLPAGRPLGQGGGAEGGMRLAGWLNQPNINYLSTIYPLLE